MSEYYETKPDLSDEDLAILAEPRIAILSTVSPNDDPHSVPCWYLYDDGRFLTTVHTETRRARNIVSRGRARILVEHQMGWISAVGAARIGTGTTIGEMHDKVSHRYLTEEGRERFFDGTAVPDDGVIELIPDRWMTWSKWSMIQQALDRGHTLEELQSWVVPIAPREL